MNFALNGTEIFEDAVASNLPAKRCTWMASPKAISANSGLVELLDEHSKGQLDSLKGGAWIGGGWLEADVFLIVIHLKHL